jgi:hypothetical protein
LRCVFLLIRISIVAILAFIPVDIPGSQVKPLEFPHGPSLPPGGWDGIVIVAFITFIFVILTASWNPKMKFVTHAIVVYLDFWVSASNLRTLKRHFGGR